MAKVLKSVFDELFSQTKFNEHLAKELYRYQIGFVNKNSEHLEFFGGNLLGVQVVRYTDKDLNRYFDDVLEIDYLSLEEDLLDTQGINPEFKVSSDALNLTTMYLIHRFLTNKNMAKEKRERAAIDAALIFYYRVTSSLLSHYFRYPADPKIAQATYARLTNRYLIKQLGSWQEVFMYRAKELISPDGIHHKTLTEFNDTEAIVQMVNDAQGRIRDMFKNIYAEFKNAHTAGDSIAITTLSDIDMDGGDVIKDKTHSPDVYQNYLISILSDQNSFIKEELVGVVAKVNESMQIRNFRNTLVWMTEQGNNQHHIKIEHFIKQVMIYSINYLAKHGYMLRDTKDLSGMMYKLKNLYLASRSSDDELAEIRKAGSEIITLACGKISEQANASIRTGIILYLCLRAFTKHYYTSH